MDKKYADNALVKSLQNAGFSDEWIESQIEAGEIKIEKSKTEKEMEDSEKDEKKNVENDEKHINALKEDEKEDKKDETLLKKDEKEKMEKSTQENLMKSISALPGAFAEAITPFFKALNTRLDEQDAAIKKIAETAPSFKSNGLNASVLQKSLQKDDNGKVELNIITQRPLVKSIIEKIAVREGIEKSLQDQALSYLMNPSADMVGEDLARYLYQKEGIALAK